MYKYIVKNSKLKNYLSSLGFRYEVNPNITNVYIFNFSLDEHYLFYRALSFYCEFEKERNYPLYKM